MICIVSCYPFIVLCIKWTHILNVGHCFYVHHQFYKESEELKLIVTHVMKNCVASYPHFPYKGEGSGCEVRCVHVG